MEDFAAGDFDGFNKAAAWREAHALASISANGEPTAAQIAEARRQLDEVRSRYAGTPQWIAATISRDWEAKHPSARSLQDAVRLELQQLGYDGIIHAPLVTLTRDMEVKLEAGEEVPLRGRYSAKKSDSKHGGVDLFNDGDHITGFDTLKELIDEAMPATYIAFQPEQIKSTGNVGTFDQNYGNSLHSIEQTKTPAFKRWFGDWRIAQVNQRVNEQIAAWERGELKGSEILDIGPAQPARVPELGRRPPHHPQPHRGRLLEPEDVQFMVAQDGRHAGPQGEGRPEALRPGLRLGAAIPR